MTRDRAVQLNTEAQAAYARINADSRLSADGKRRDKLQVWAKLDADLAKIKAETRIASDRRQNELERKLFGLPQGAPMSDVMGYRDASTRAASLSSEREAAYAMDDAHRIGDAQLVRAIAAQAAANGWQQITAAYVTQVKPADAAALTEYVELVSPSASTTARAIEDWAFMATPPDGIVSHGRTVNLTADLQAAAAEAGIEVEYVPQPPAGGLLRQIAGANRRSLDDGLQQVANGGQPNPLNGAAATSTGDAA